VPPIDRYLDLPTGIRAHYLEWTAGGAVPPLVLAHATGFLARLWEPVAERLGSRAIYAPDTRGHGDSDKPPPSGDTYHWSHFVEDLRAFLDALGLKGAHFAGHSAGGSAGLYLAAHEPQYFSRLVLIEPIVMPGGLVVDESRRNDMAEGARRRRAVFASREEMFEQYRTRSLFDRWPDGVLRLYCEHGTFVREDGSVQLKCPGDVEGEVFANSGSLNIWDVLPDVTAPALVLRGEHAEAFTAMAAEAVAKRLPNARLVDIPGAGHLAPMERPDAVADLIREFLA
jgi:pimeloyl-ACP methyl ester carboxylesterase